MSTDRESGAATTELALVVTLLMPLLAWSLFFFELGAARLKVQQATRFLSWELTVMPLSDFQQARHDGAFEQARRELLTEVQRSKNFTASVAPRDGISLHSSPLSVRLESEDAGLLDPSAAHAHFTEPGQDFDAVFGRFAFSRKGLVQARVSATAKTLFNLRNTDGLLHDAGLPEGVAISFHDALLVDSWALPTGEAIETQTGTSCTSDYCRQVARMAFLGAERLMDPIEPRLARFKGVIGYRDPLAAVVASLPLSGGRADSAVELLVARSPGHTPLKKFFTNVFKDRLNPSASPTHEAYVVRGEGYLGCRRAETQEGQCPYSP